MGGSGSKKGDEDAEDYQHVDTGDSLKMKQILDESTVKAVIAKGYEEVHYVDNLKITLMIIACAFACCAQFCPIPFPKCRPVLGVCCSGYFVFSGILQLVTKFIEQDTVLVTKPRDGRQGLRVRTAFPRFQMDFTVIVQYDVPGSPELEESHCVGKFFDADGYYAEQLFLDTVQKLVLKYDAKKSD